MLGAAGIQPPHILVGHSAGAIHMLVYAKRYPQEVAGMVLVEPSHPEMFTRLKQVPGPGAMAALYGGLAAQGGDYAAARHEAAAGTESFASARVEPGGLGDLPLVVLTAEWWVTGMPTKLKQAFIPLREEMARFSTRGRHLIVTGCDHANLPLVRSAAVADAVRDVLALRAG